MHRRDLPDLQCHNRDDEPPGARAQSVSACSTPTIPVDWYPWGDEAFAKARAEDKPIFLSIGYSTCHWCHVMEHESFEDAGVAAVLNEHFVSIKVDREERPDVDRVYMTFVQATTGSGGWPMSVWLTPELKPFYGGTYFPPDVAVGTARLRRHPAARSRASGARSATKVERVGRRRSPSSCAAIDAGRAGGRRCRRRALLAQTVAQFRAVVRLAARRLRRRAEVSAAERAAVPAARARAHRRRRRARHGAGARCGRWRSAACATTSAAASTAIRSTRAWRVPHFEKMLYDQAQLVLAYLEGAQASGDPFYLEVAEDTLRYVMREMTDDGGRLLFGRGRRQRAARARRRADAAQDGRRVLPLARRRDRRAARRRCRRSSSGGSASSRTATRPIDPQQEFTGKNLLYVAAVDRRARRANSADRRQDVARRCCARARLAMFQARLARPRPHLDDKVLTAWNGLMIAAFARVARVLRALGRGRRDAGDAVPRRGRTAAASFIRDGMWNGDTRTLLRRYRDGHAEIDGYAEDYAYLIFGLLELFQADPRSAVARVGRRRCSGGRTSCSGTRRTAAGSARPAAIRACCCG